MVLLVKAKGGVGAPPDQRHTLRVPRGPGDHLRDLGRKGSKRNKHENTFILSLFSSTIQTSHFFIRSISYSSEDLIRTVTKLGLYRILIWPDTGYPAG